MVEHEYAIVVQPLPDDEGGGFIAFAPDLRGCLADGDTPEEALSEIRQAIGEWIDEAKRLKRRVPAPGECAAEARQEFDKLNKLVHAQDKVLKEQDRRLQESREEIGKIREALDLLRGDEDQDACRLWGRRMPLHTVHVPPRRKPERRPH